jgi:hypothetical protein
MVEHMINLAKEKTQKVRYGGQLLADKYVCKLSVVVGFSDARSCSVTTA